MMNKGDEVMIVDWLGKVPEGVKKHVVDEVGEVFVKFKCGQRSYKAVLGIASLDSKECWGCYDG